MKSEKEIGQSILETLNDALDEGIKSMSERGTSKVIKSVPATKAEQALNAQMEKDTKTAMALLRKTLTDRERFWAMVNVRLDSFSHPHLSYNKELKEIEFRE